MPVPPIALAISFWLHMLATVVWVGGLALTALLVWPSTRRTLGDRPERAALMADLRRRFNPLAWISLATLVVTGLIQMTANQNYNGFLAVNNRWTAAILAKHLAVAGMILIGAYMQWGVAPALARLALLEARGHSAPEAAALRRREEKLTRLNLLCGVLVLALTAVARVV